MGSFSSKVSSELTGGGKNFEDVTVLALREKTVRVWGENLARCQRIFEADEFIPFADVKKLFSKIF